MRRMYGDRVAVAYRQYATLEDAALCRQVLPLPSVLVNGAVILRGNLHIQVIASRLADLGVLPDPPEGEGKVG
jgi:hypothetical protein